MDRYINFVRDAENEEQEKNSGEDKERETSDKEEIDETDESEKHLAPKLYEMPKKNIQMVFAAVVTSRQQEVYLRCVTKITGNAFQE